MTIPTKPIGSVPRPIELIEAIEASAAALAAKIIEDG